MPSSSDVRLDRLQQLPKGDPGAMPPTDAAIINVRTDSSLWIRSCKAYSGRLKYQLT